MRRMILACGVAVAHVTLWSSVAHAQTVAVGPYYASPSWDQTLPAATRFVVLSNFDSAAVLDRETGLVWERSPSTDDFPAGPAVGVFGGLTAQEHCMGLELGHRMGWRVPAAAELASLIDKSQAPIGLPAGHPFMNVQGLDAGGFPLLYWTSTQYRNTVAEAFRTVIFGAPFTGIGTASAAHPSNVWCVRGGAGTDTQ